MIKKPQNPFFRDSGRKVEDVYIAVMGVTGAGKSTFIQECSGRKVGIGHSLKSFTIEVEDFSFMYNPGIRIHLIDTPGFDDTELKETDILRKIAGWLGDAYDSKIKLSGLVYLHRISDPRMPGSAKRNLHMFQRLCGPQCLPGVVLVTTMWSLVSQEDGLRRERELMETEEFWAWMVRNGSRVVRHSGTKESAITILEDIIQKRLPMLLNLQLQMNVEGKGLEETDAGIKLNEELFEVERKHKEEVQLLEEDKQDALRRKDKEAALQIAESQREFQQKVDHLQKQREQLEVDMKELKEKREEEFNAIQAKLDAQAKELVKREREYQNMLKDRKQDRETHDQMVKERRQEIEEMRAELQEAKEAAERKKPGFWRRVGNFVEEVLDEIFD